LLGRLPGQDCRTNHKFVLPLAKDIHVTPPSPVTCSCGTIYSPLLVYERFLIEPTETKEAIDDFIDAMAKILEEASAHPETVTEAPFTEPVRRLDEVKAAKELDSLWSQ